MSHHSVSDLNPQTAMHSDVFQRSRHKMNKERKIEYFFGAECMFVWLKGNQQQQLFLLFMNSVWCKSATMYCS